MIMTKAKPKPKIKQPESLSVVCNTSGVAVANVQTYTPPLAKNLRFEVTIEAGWFAGFPIDHKDRRIAGWRAAVSFHSGIFARATPLTIKRPPYTTQALAVCSAVEDLINDLVDRRDAARGEERRRLNAVVESLSRWQETFGNAHPDPQPFPPRSHASSAVKSTAIAVIDVPSTPALEKLSAAERKELAGCEKEIREAAHAFLKLGQAWSTIQEGRLYRETHATFEAYLAEVWQTEKSVAYRSMKAFRLSQETSAIADKLNVRLTNEAQYRALEKLEPKDAVEVLKAASRKIKADPEGRKTLTAKILAEEVKRYTTSPDDLKREAERRKEASRESRPSSHATPAASHEEPETEPFAITAPQSPAGPGVNLGVMGRWHLSFNHELPRDGSHPGYWNGVPNVNAWKLRGLATCLREALQFDALRSIDRSAVASLLKSIASELEHGKLPHEEPAERVPGTPDRRRAK